MARGDRVVVRRRRDGLELRVDGTFASLHRPGRVTTGSVWDALAAPMLALPAARRRRVLVLGLGAGSAARIVRALAPRARIVGVEIDGEVLAAARKHFGLDALGVEVVRADARAYLARARGAFDLVLDDVFVGRGRRVHKPDWLLDPGLDMMTRRLAPGGVIACNTLDEGPQLARRLRARVDARVRIAIEGYDNHIWAGGPACLSGASLRRAIAANPVLAPTLPALRLRSA